MLNGLSAACEDKSDFCQLRHPRFSNKIAVSTKLTLSHILSHSIGVWLSSPKLMQEVKFWSTFIDLQLKGRYNLKSEVLSTSLILKCSQHDINSKLNLPIQVCLLGFVWVKLCLASLCGSPQ